MLVFVTGATGFVGANIVQLLLQEGHAVRALVRPTSRLDNLRDLNAELVEGDLNAPDLWCSMQSCQAVFHVAAHYSLLQRDRDQLYRHNVLGTRNVLAAAQKAGVERTVYTSSVAAIGTDGRGTVLDETHQSKVDSLIGYYKQSKYWAEQEAVKAARAGQNVVIVNPTSPVGEWDIKPTPTGDIILRFLRRQMPFYMDTGLNFVDVQDVAWGHVLAWQRGRTGERYILGHQNLTLKALLDLLAKLTGLPAPRRSLPTWLPLAAAWVDESLLAPFGKTPSIPIDGVRMATQKMYYTPAKAVQELGLPQTPVASALQRAIAWFTTHEYLS